MKLFIALKTLYVLLSILISGLIVASPAIVTEAFHLPEGVMLLIVGSLPAGAFIAVLSFLLYKHIFEDVLRAA